jgi:hypothetical protein
MNGWKQAIIKGMMPGALASVASAGVLALRAQREAGSIYAGTNAISHWLWGSKAFRRRRARRRLRDRRRHCRPDQRLPAATEGKSVT